MTDIVVAEGRAEGRAASPKASRGILLLLDDASLAPGEAQWVAGAIVPNIMPADGWKTGGVRFADYDAVVAQVRDPHAGDFARLVEAVNGAVPVLAASAGLTVETMRVLLHAGAADVLPLPVSVAEVRQSLDAVRTRGPGGPGTRPGPASRRGRVVSFLGAIGGVGNSSIATQTGILATDDMRTCYIDFDLQFGNAALLLDLHPSLHIGQLIEEGESLDAGILQSVVVHHGSGMALIASPTEMVPIEVIDTDFVDRALSLVTQHYGLVIVDLPTLWSEWTMRILQRSDLIFLVSDLSVPSLYQARRQLDMVNANGLAPKLKMIANRVQKGMFAKADMKETEAALGRKVDFTVANDYPTISAANNQGRAVRDVRAGSRVLKDLEYLSRSLVETVRAAGASE